MGRVSSAVVELAGMHICRTANAGIQAKTMCAAYTKRFNNQRDLSTFVPDHPSLNAASCANSSPNPSINPLTNGNSRLIAAPRSRPHIVGGEYNIIGDLEEEGGEGERSLFEDS